MGLQGLEVTASSSKRLFTIRSVAPCETAGKLLGKVLQSIEGGLGVSDSTNTALNMPMMLANIGTCSEVTNGLLRVQVLTGLA
jgi:hypothetical protein